MVRLIVNVSSKLLDFKILIISIIIIIIMEDMGIIIMVEVGETDIFKGVRPK